jgi:sec-independent protein translocase protein TatB
MFDIGWTELVVIGVVALIVIGPKDLPEMFRTLGRFTGKARSMARDFQRAMEQAADDSGVKDVANDLKGMTSPRNLGLEKVKEAVTKFEKWEPLKPEPKPVASAAPAAVATPPGPATQALMDEKAEQRARHAAAVSALTKPAPVAAVGPVAAAPAAEAAPAASSAPAATPAPKPKAARPAPAPKDPIGKAVAAAQGDAPKPARKPRAKKPDAGTSET